ncbi:MAG TPA: hypothetical protein VGO11_15775 [Chthoniobacteraceae bacterium]|jgi:hypothetical protein|nr:hypothetical protein [Chthoniobacteraceae bacterium]
MKADRDVLSILRALQRRLTAQLLAAQMARAALVAAGVLVALAILDHWHVPAIWSAPLVAAVMASALGWAAFSALHRRPDLAATAGVADRAAGTRDRLATALEFTALPDAEPRRLALRECTAYVRGLNFAPHLPWRWPREVRWLWVPLCALALLRWDAQVAAARHRAEVESATRAMAPALSELQKLAQEMQKRGEPGKSDEMKRLAEELRQSVERLRADAKNSGDAQKSTLRELSALEDLVRQMQEQQRAQFTAEELQELAKALRENQVTEEAGRQLGKGEFAATAESLEKKAEELATKGDERTAEEIRKALQAALDRVAQQKQLSPSGRQAAQQSGAPTEAMKKLAALLRKMPDKGGSSPGRPGEPMSPQALQRLLSALEDLKQGEGKSGQPGAPKGGESEILMQAFDHRPSDMQEAEKNARPTGLPGGELDRGTTDTPFAEKSNPSTPKGADLALSGLQGAGETASQLLPGAISDDSRARRKYKELYEAMAPAAEEAVQQENIPLGSRYFVKRYFEAIRPKE